MSRLIRRILLLLVLLAIVAGIAWTFTPKPIEVDVAVIDYGSLRITVDEDGRTRIRERYIVSAPLSGRLQRIGLRAGDEVESERTVLAVIEPTDPTLLDIRARAEAEARIQAAEAAVSRAQTLLARSHEARDFARRERERLQAVQDRDAARPRELDAMIFAERLAEQDVRSAEFERDIATFELKQARAALLRTAGELDRAEDEAGLDLAGSPHFLVRSPIDGKVLRVLQESMAVVAAGTPLLEVGDPRDLEIVVDVLSRDAARIPPGAPVMISEWGGDTTLEGTVRRVEPSAFTKISSLGIEEQRVNVIVDLDSPGEIRTTLGDGFRVDAHIVLWEQPRVLKVPTSAIFREGDRWLSYVLDTGRLQRREVSIGRRSGLEAEVTAGLTAGELVVIYPSDRLRDGVRAVRRP